MGHYVPHTDAEIAEMLTACGLSSVVGLFASAPAALRLATGLDLPPGLSEPDVLAAFDELAAANSRCGPDLVCFAGAGAYDHAIPSIVRRGGLRAGNVNPRQTYQPSVSHGGLPI